MKPTKIAFCVALATGAMAAQADSIFFPYVVSGGAVTTVINVIDTAEAGAVNYYNASGNREPAAGTPGFNRLHYTLVNKVGSAVNDTNATCGEVNYFLPSSPFDLQTIDLGGQYSLPVDRGVLFNDPSINNNWRPAVSGGLTYALAQAAGQGQAVRGYLVVDNANDNAAVQTLAGEAFVFEFASGAVWGYRAQPVLGDFETSGAPEFVYAGGAMPPFTPVSFLPLGEAVTNFFVTPVGAALALANHPNPNPLAYGSLTANIRFVTGAGAAYDRDENLVSGSETIRVTCVGSVGITQLLSLGAQTALATGGWGRLVAFAPVAEGTPVANAAPRIWVANAHVIKREFNSGGTFNSQAAPGVYNNAVQLRP